MTSDRRKIPDRRKMLFRPGGRRATDTPAGNGWSTGQIANHIGMSADFVLKEIKAGEIVASQFGREYRVAGAEVRRYLIAKGYPLPDTLTL